MSVLALRPLQAVSGVEGGIYNPLALLREYTIAPYKLRYYWFCHVVFLSLSLQSRHWLHDEPNPRLSFFTKNVVLDIVSRLSNMCELLESIHCVDSTIRVSLSNCIFSRFSDST